MDNPLVSVVIAVYNGEKLIKRAVDSVLSQSYKNIELVLVDDGSKDKTLEILRELEVQNKNVIVLVNKQNFGFVKSLNKGVEAANGKYIARLDDDDFWFDDKKIEKQVNFLEKNSDYVLCGGGLIKIDFNGSEKIRYLFPQKDQDIRKNILVDNLFAHSATVFLKESFLKVSGYDKRFGFFADMDLWLKLGKLGKFYNFPEYFVCYLDKESDNNYNTRNNLTRRKIISNIKLRSKYKKDYPGFLRSILICLASFVYSFLPLRNTLWKVLFKIRTIIIGKPPYQYYKQK
jgi:glycosyltransferase involved in cell wall biosynthesis